MKDFAVIPKLLNKDELRTIMRTYNHTIAKQAEQSYVDYKGFKGVYCQLAFFAYSRRSLDYSHLPPVVSLKFFMNFMRDSLKAKGENTEIFDEPDPGTGDKDVVRSLNKLMAKDPKATVPEGYEKIADKEIKVFFSIPSILGLPPSYKYSIEILDDLLDKTLGIRLIEPQIEYFNTYRVKGIFNKKEKKEIKELPPIYERNNEAASKRKIESVSPKPNNLGKKMSSFLKLKLANIPAKDKERYEECAYVLEDVLHSVKLKMNRVINRAPKAGAQLEKFEAFRERERKDEENKKIEEERRRKARQQMLLEEVNKAKEQRRNLLREDEEKRKQEAMFEEYRKKEADERLKREKEEKKRKLEE